ncbi:MAG: SDR family oxidoreductase [Roseibium sp.]|uniref:SDR family NAD(P)-dependent oxidoreductase n=1 Tax=Roseibium sp. TaxID=1936156 RepID=UPI0026204A08|nr:SDR family oxidoreductase [Roseibium sp.]MCV0424158.1 SDR family oxidoreductase [Roseibium sp.]
MNSSKPLSGKTALVTGSANQGIGRSIALALAEAGADLTIHSRDDMEQASELAREISRFGVYAHPEVLDFATPNAARELVRSTISHFGKIDILVNNAGFTIRKSIMECDDAEFEALLNVNLQCYFAAAQEAARDMIGRRAEGRLIFVSSVNQDIVMPGQGLYCATKGGVRQLAKAMALELAPQKITSNLIAPGLVFSDFNSQVMRNEDFYRFATAGIPMERGASPDEIAGTAVYLALPSSSYVTGASITVDGGKSLP